jgi:hypothetical protein
VILAVAVEVVPELQVRQTVTQVLEPLTTVHLLAVLVVLELHYSLLGVLQQAQGNYLAEFVTTLVAVEVTEAETLAA